VYGLLFVYPLTIIARDSLADGGSAWGRVFHSPVLGHVVLNTVVVCVYATVITVPVAYLCAAAVWRSRGVKRLVILGFVLLPFWTSVLAKSFAWAAVLQAGGVLSDVLNLVGLPASELLHTRTAVIIGMVHYLIPYAFFPILVTMLALDERVLQAAQSLGASRRQVITQVVLPLTRTGTYAAGLLVFIISAGFFVTPALLGGPGDMMLANLIDGYTNDLIDFPGAAVIALLVAVCVSVLVAIYIRLSHDSGIGTR
jgi:ABC-type spermidine/putrescine transport system permease subunit I